MFTKPFKLYRCLLIVGSSLLLSLLVSACNPLPEPSLRVGTNIWPGYEPLYLARSLGYYDNTPIKLIELNSASDVIHAMRNGSLEAAALTLDEALTMSQDGIKLKLVLVMDFSDGGDVLLVKPELDTLQDLRGKTVAVENTATGAVLLDGALQLAGLTVSDINITSCTIDEQLDCYRTADAVVTFEPIKTQLLKLGAKQLFDSSQIPNRIVDVLVVLEQATQTNPRAIKQLVNGYLKAQYYLTAKPDDAARRVAPRMAISPEEVLSSFEGINIPSLQQNQELLLSQPAEIEVIADRLMRFMLKNNLLRDEVETDGLSDGSFLPGIQL